MTEKIDKLMTVIVKQHTELLSAIEEQLVLTSVPSNVCF